MKTIPFNPQLLPTLAPIGECSQESQIPPVMSWEKQFLFLKNLSLSTLVEAMLNSRPLTPLSNNLSDSSALTQEHFWTGSSLLNSESLTKINPLNRLKCWQLVYSLHQRLWKYWYQHYLRTLMQRQKWNVPTPNLNQEIWFLCTTPALR